MIVRDYRRDDFAEMLRMGRAMWRASPEFSGFSFDPERLIPLSEACLNNDDVHCFVAEDPSGVLGFFVGGVSEFFFSKDRYAFDLALFVREGRRGSFAAVRLIAVAAEWAKARDASQLRFGAATGINPAVADRFFKGLGFAASGVLYTRAP